ncbi:MAG: RES domain-containing protein, partial [Candidatus Bipolaricaulia bacterium]
QVCRAEIRRRVTDPKFLRQPLVCAEVQVTLRKVLDLSDDRVLRELGIERGDLMRVTGDEAEDYRLTREIARAARAAGFEALKVPSVTTCGSNLVVFSDRLSRSSGLELLDLRPVDW